MICFPFHKNSIGCTSLMSLQFIIIFCYGFNSSRMFGHHYLNKFYFCLFMIFLETKTLLRQFFSTILQSGPLFPTEVRMNLPGAKLNPQICPSNPDLLAFINNQDIYVTHTVTGYTIGSHHTFIISFIIISIIIFNI